MTDPQLSTLNPKTINHQETTPRAESPLATEPKRPKLWVDPFSVGNLAGLRIQMI